MANNRLTWQQVAAPDFGDALRGFGTAGQLFSEGAGSFSDAMSAMQRNRQERESAVALEKAMQIQDAQQWDQMMQSGGFEALGISPNNATPELMNFLANNRSTLAGNARDDLNLQAGQFDLDRRHVVAGQTDASHALAMQTNAERESDANRDRDLRYGRDAHNFGIEITDQARADEAYEAELLNAENQEEYKRIAAEVVKLPTTLDEARRTAMSLGLDPNATEAVMGYIDQMPAETWTVDPRFEGTSDLNPQFKLAQDAISARENAANISSSQNPIGRLYQQGLQAAEGYASPVHGMVERLRGNMDPGTEDNIVRSSAATIFSQFDRYEKEFPNVPQAIIAAVMENNLDRAHIFSGQVNFDRQKIRSELREFGTEENLTLLESQRAGNEATANENRELRQRYDQLQLQYEMYVSRGDEVSQQRVLDELSGLMNVMGVAQE